MKHTHCIVIPHYNHLPQLTQFLPLLAAADLPALVIDDGSDADTVTSLKSLVVRFPWVTLHERSTNGGKGAATMTGLNVAAALGFSHIILVDADGQHDPADIVHIHAESRQHPQAILSGNPQFGPDIPAARLYGREITNVLARLEAGNSDLKDAMCGLRAYPVEATIRLAQDAGARLRMELDTELLVRACWNNIEVRFLDTQVVYPKDGASHFRMGWDNVRMTAMHFRLLFGALLHRPRRRRQAP